MPDHLQTAEQIQKKIYSKMTYTEKYRQLLAFRQLAWDLKTAWVKERFPHLDDQAVEDMVRDIFIKSAMGNTVPLLGTKRLIEGQGY